MRLFTRQRRAGGGFDPVEVSEKGGVRYLHLGSSAVQSAMRIREPFALELEYTRAMMAFLLFHPEPREIALLGLGAGSMAKFIHRHLNASHLTAVELNPEVIAAARGYFFLPPDDARLTVLEGDGAAYVRTRQSASDILLVDAYDARRIVEDLASPGFYADCLCHLRPGGVAAFNLWGSDRHFGTYWQRIRLAFDGQALILPAEKKSNVIVMAFRAPLPALSCQALRARAQELEAATGLEMPAFVERIKAFNPGAGHGFGL